MMGCKTLPDGLVNQLRELMIILIEGRRDNDEALLPDGYVRWRDAERVLREYPAAFVLPPQNFLDPVEWIELDDGTGFSIDCPLWSLEERRSDLEVRLFAITAGDGAWDLNVTDILAP
jgi:hypothetical protein